MLRLTVTGDREIARRMEGIADRMDDISPVLRAVRQAWLTSNRRTFTLRGRGNWPPLDPATRARKGGRPPMVATGRLLAQLSAAPPINELSRTRLRVGTADPVARFHHEGRGNPQRRLVQLNRAEFERDAIRELRRHLTGRL